MITAVVTFVISTSHYVSPNLICDCYPIELEERGANVRRSQQPCQIVRAGLLALKAVVEAQNGSRLVAMLNELESDWTSAILGDMAKVKQYEHGFTMNCRVIYAAES